MGEADSTKEAEADKVFRRIQAGLLAAHSTFLAQFANAPKEQRLHVVQDYLLQRLDVFAQEYWGINHTKSYETLLTDALADEVAPLLRQYDDIFGDASWSLKVRALLEARKSHYLSQAIKASLKAESNSNDRTASGDSGGNRRAAVEAFILKCQQETSLKVSRTHIWKAAGHSTARQFQFWQASDPKATAQDDQNFRRILAMKPTDFIALLRKKGIISNPQS